MTTPSERPLDLGRRLTGWVDVCELDEIEDARGKAVVVKGTDVALMRDGDEVFAVGGTCPHRGGQIADGRVVDGEAICPLHLWDFDLETGISRFNPNDTLPSYRARVRDGRVEIDADSVDAGPGRPDVYLGPWLRRGATDRGMELVHGLATGGRAPIDSMGANRYEPTLDQTRPSPSLDDIVFVPAQLVRRPLLENDPVDTTVVLGSRAERPLRLDIPILVSHMSFGALSREAKIALATGARESGTAIGSGEGGVLPAEREAAGSYIVEMATGYFGWGEEAIAGAAAVELKIGQGAKPGMGGMLPGSKVTEEIARVRGIEPGEPSVSPSRFTDIDNTADLRQRIDWIRTVGDGIPIGIKLSAGNVLVDVDTAIEAGADYLVIDGIGGGTGAAPVHVREHVGIPSWVAVDRVRRHLDRRGHHDVQVVATGGIRTPDEMAKVLALGADAVAVATAAMMAIGCQQYRACHRGTCPVGIATQDERRRRRFDVDISAERLTNFLGGATSMMVDYARLAGHHSLSALSRDDLRSLHPTTADLLDLDLML